MRATSVVQRLNSSRQRKGHASATQTRINAGFACDAGDPWEVHREGIDRAARPRQRVSVLVLVAKDDRPGAPAAEVPRENQRRRPVEDASHDPENEAPERRVRSRRREAKERASVGTRGPDASGAAKETPVMACMALLAYTW